MSSPYLHRLMELKSNYDYLLNDSFPLKPHLSSQTSVGNNLKINRKKSLSRFVDPAGLEPATFRFLPHYVTIASIVSCFKVPDISVVPARFKLTLLICGLDCLFTILKFLQVSFRLTGCPFTVFTILWTRI